MNKYIESLFWLAGLTALFFLKEGGASLCMVKQLGIADSCMGCGIGHAIHDALHGRWAEATEEHFMGIPATLILLFQIVKPFLNRKN